MQRPPDTNNDERPAFEKGTGFVTNQHDLPIL
jgi:hypothetical protein